jgi:hypothetical protein
LRSNQGRSSGRFRRKEEERRRKEEEGGGRGRKGEDRRGMAGNLTQ